MEGRKKKSTSKNITHQCSNATNAAAEHSCTCGIIALMSNIHIHMWEIMHLWARCESGEAPQSFGLGKSLQNHKGWARQGLQRPAVAVKSSANIFNLIYHPG